MPTRSPIALRAALFALAYFAAAEVGHALSFPGHAFATCWPPSGVYLFALTLSPRRHRPLFVLAALPANLASDVLVHGQPVWVGLLFWAANSLEAVVGSWLLCRRPDPRAVLTDWRRLLEFVVLCGVLAPAVGAAVGAGAVRAAGGESYWAAWRVWWAADALGVLLVGTLGLALAAPARDPRLAGGRWRAAEGVLVFLLVTLATVGVFRRSGSEALAFPYMALPFLVWTGLRLGPRWTAVALCEVALVAIGQTTRGYGPIAAVGATVPEQALLLQMYLAIAAVTTLSLAAAIRARDDLHLALAGRAEDLRRALAEIRTLQGILPICGHCKRIRDDGGYWEQLETYVRQHTDAEFSHGICPECGPKYYGDLWAAAVGTTTQFDTPPG